MELRQALGRISEIREQMERSSVFRGYRAVPVAITGILAMVGGAVQPVLVPDPATSVAGWIDLWIGVAAVSVLVAGTEILIRYFRSASDLARARTRIALYLFLPSLVAGMGLTAVLYRLAPESTWLLPGLWSMLFGLGIFASVPVLPRALAWVGAYYFVVGFLSLYLARGEHAFSPYAMAVPFGVGQLMAAWHLYWTLERNHDES